MMSGSSTSSQQSGFQSRSNVSLWALFVMAAPKFKMAAVFLVRSSLFLYFVSSGSPSWIFRKESPPLLRVPSKFRAVHWLSLAVSVDKMGVMHLKSFRCQ